VLSTTDQTIEPLQSLTLTIPQAAQMLGISISKTYEAARAGQLPIIRIGTRVLISRKRLEDFVNGIEDSIDGGDEADRHVEHDSGRQRRKNGSSRS
jgi:excisionase family DNA binding protein